MQISSKLSHQLRLKSWLQKLLIFGLIHRIYYFGEVCMKGFLLWFLREKNLVSEKNANSLFCAVKSSNLNCQEGQYCYFNQIRKLMYIKAFNIIFGCLHKLIFVDMKNIYLFWLKNIILQKIAVFLVNIMLWKERDKKCWKLGYTPTFWLKYQY